MKRILVPGQPPPQPEPLINHELWRRELRRQLRSASEFERLRRLDELRRSMPRARE